MGELFAEVGAGGEGDGELDIGVFIGSDEFKEVELGEEGLGLGEAERVAGHDDRDEGDGEGVEKVALRPAAGEGVPR